MAFNSYAVRRKLIARASPQQLARARAAITATPGGALARRLGVDQPQPPSISPAPQGPVSVRGGRVRMPQPVITPESTQVKTNVERKINRASVPGSRFK